MKIDAPPAQVRTARIVAIAADAIQLAVMPLFGPGFASPANAVLDVVVAVALTRLVGFHWSFLPTFLIELVPGVDFVPTWTAAVLLATRGQGTPRPEPKPEIKDITPGRG